MNDFFKNFDSNKIKKFSSTLNQLSPTEFVSLVSIAAIILIKYINPNEQNTLGNFLEMIGQILILNDFLSGIIVFPTFRNSIIHYR